ncbi:uncharacterized protein LOC121643539 [Melanotaenia boesemani]|uniref:uncharacterized protein LOC121643539 n=1 Tax=Melanotaenia boesemani TaxID=1250792 RepID=UPI001C0569E8|nr:uncharacterized protein LOC121643539 [Melanotaenia boesemani]
MEAGRFYDSAAKRPKRVTKQPSPSSRKSKTPVVRGNVRLVKKKAANIVNSAGGSHAGSIKPFFEAEVRALKSRVAAMESARDSCHGNCITETNNIVERLDQLEASIKNIESRLECLERPAPQEEDPLPSQEPFPHTTTDFEVRALPAEREEEFFRLCHRGGHPRPESYAAGVFMALTPFRLYKDWGKTVNWSGSNGKQPLPRINERLRSPRKTDPETQRPGFCR